MSNEIPKQMSEFLRSEHILSLCVCCENDPYVSSAFYAFCDDLGALIIASDEHTKHMQIIKENPKVAVNIAHHTKIVGLIKGIQAKGQIKPLSEFQSSEQKAAKKAYFGAFPYALILNPSLYVISLEWMKLTNNALAKKQIWQKE